MGVIMVKFVLISLVFSSFLSLSKVAEGVARTGIPGNPKAPKGGIFYYHLSSAPSTLNPLSSSDYYASQVQSYVIESLAKRNIETLDWMPALAQTWAISKDGMAFTFTLREGVQWQDGKPLTIEDVKFSFDAIMDPKNTYQTAHQRPYYENIKEAKILDEKTIRFVASKKYFNNFNVLAELVIVPRHVHEKPSEKQKKKLNKTLMGTGPYILDKYKRGKSITLKANPQWWGLKDSLYKGIYNFKKIRIKFVKEETVRLQMLERQDLDFMGLTPEQYIKKTDGPHWGKDVYKVKTKNSALQGYGFIGWNLRNPLFKSRKTRKALYHLVNRDLMIEKFRYNFSIPATGPNDRSSIYTPSDVKPVKFNPKLALKLLRQDGWKDTNGDRILDKVIDGKKTKFSFTILEPRKIFEKYLTVFKEDAKKAGIDVNIKIVEWNTFIKLLNERKFEAVRLGWSSSSIDWDPKQIWHSNYAKAGSNFIGYKNPTVDKLIDEARTIFDREKRVKILHKVFKMIAEDYPYVFFFNSDYIFYGHTKRMAREKDTYRYSIGSNYWWIKK